MRLRKVSRSIASSLAGCVALSVEARGVSRMIAISPKSWPGPSVETLTSCPSSSRTTSSSPSTTMKSLSAGPPWRTTTSPASTCIACSSAPIVSPTSFGRSLNTFRTVSRRYSTPKFSLGSPLAVVLSMNSTCVGAIFRK